MTETVVSQEAHTQAVIAALRAAGLRVGEGVAPEDEEEPVGWQGQPGASDFHGYVVVHPISGGSRGGTLDDPEADMWYIADVMTIGATQRQAERLVDLASVAIMAINVPGRRLMRHPMHDFGSAQVRRDDQPEPGLPVLWYGTPRYRIWTTPA